MKKLLLLFLVFSLTLSMISCFGTGNNPDNNQQGSGDNQGDIPDEKPDKPDEKPNDNPDDNKPAPDDDGEALNEKIINVYPNLK